MVKKRRQSIVIAAHGIGDSDNTYNVISINSHPDYQSVTGINNDFCLLEVSSDFDFSVAGPVCLPDSGDHISPTNSTCFVGGWGALASGGSLPDYAQSVGVTIYSEEECSSQSYYGQSQIDFNTEFCAGDIDGGTDSCQGDSGQGCPKNFFPIT